MTTLSHFVLRLFAMVALATSASAQVAPAVPSTGCPGAPRILSVGSPSLKQTIAFGTDFGQASASVMALGFGTGMGIDLSALLPMCSAPCAWYLAPIGSSYISTTAIGPRVLLAIAIPADRNLLFQTYCVQALGLDTTVGCIRMTHAVPFSITF